MSMFNIGDRVRCIESYQDGIFPDECGVIMGYDFQGRAGVKLDNYHKKRHGLQGTVERGYGWWVPERCLTYEMAIQDFGELPTLDISSIL